MGGIFKKVEFSKVEKQNKNLHNFDSTCGESSPVSGLISLTSFWKKKTMKFDNGHNITAVLSYGVP